MFTGKMPRQLDSSTALACVWGLVLRPAAGCLTRQGDFMKHPNPNLHRGCLAL